MATRAPAPRVSDSEATQAHYTAQAALAAAFLRLLAPLLPSLRGADAETALPAFKAALATLIGRFGEASATLAADYFEEARTEAGIPGQASVPMVDPPTVEHVENLVDWTTREVAPADRDEFEQAISEMTEQMVLDTGRNELIEAIEADRQARGFARVTKPGACSFCLLLATRGAVYKTRESAGVVKASTVWPDAKGEINRYHENCRCTVQPVFADHYEPPAHIREAAALYKRSTKDEGDKLNAFRRAVEGSRSDG